MCQYIIPNIIRQQIEKFQLFIQRIILHPINQLPHELPTILLQVILTNHHLDSILPFELIIVLRLPNRIHNSRTDLRKQNDTHEHTDRALLDVLDADRGHVAVADGGDRLEHLLPGLHLDHRPVCGQDVEVEVAVPQFVRHVRVHCQL